MLKVKNRWLSGYRVVVSGSVVYPCDPAAATAQDHKTVYDYIICCISQVWGKKSNLQVWFLLNVYCFCIILKSDCFGWGPSVVMAGAVYALPIIPQASSIYKHTSCCQHLQHPSPNICNIPAANTCNCLSEGCPRLREPALFPQTA